MTKIGNVKSFIKSLYYANKPLKMAKEPHLPINIKAQDEYVVDMIGENVSSLANYAKMHGLNVNITQKGNSVLIN
ncbi:MAG: hypothetical protein MJ231_05855, partial [bacterium]|nr:hypothetical protein [bacterium]